VSVMNGSRSIFQCFMMFYDRHYTSGVCKKMKIGFLS
jgi:hypothetical protein